MHNSDNPLLLVYKFLCGIHQFICIGDSWLSVSQHLKEKGSIMCYQLAHSHQ